MPSDNCSLVSVICLSYQHEKFVERALRSVIGQTYSNFEIIFIDNCSDDESFEIGKAILESSHSNFFLHKTHKNLGTAAGVNFAIKSFATGKYIATIACDDFWDMYNLEEKVKYFEENPSYGMVYGNGYNYFDDTKEMRLYYKKPSISGWILKELLQASPINPQGILYRHDVIKQFNYFDEKAKVEDRDLWYKIAEKYPIGYLHVPLTFYRSHTSNISSNINYIREGNEYFFKKYEARYPKEIKIARIKQERFFAYTMSKQSPTFKTLFKLINNFKFNWLYTKEVARCFILALKKIKPNNI
jgi:glycosyltransferase involved in cell wall biosynthesis